MKRRVSAASAWVVLATLTFTPAASAQEGPPKGLTGTVVVVNKRANNASFIDLATGTIVATVPTGEGPHELVVSSDGRTAVATNYNAGNSLTVYDIPTATTLRTIPLDDYPRPHGIVFMTGDEVVAITSEVSAKVVLVRLSDGAVVGEAATEARGSHMLGVTTDGGTAWTGDIGSNTVTEIDLNELKKVRSFPAPAQPEAVNVAPNGSRVFAGSNATGRVTAFDTSDGSTTLVAEGFGWPYRIFLTPDVEQIIVPDLRGETLRFFDGNDYTELGRIDFPGAAPEGLTLHSDGRHLFLSLSQSNQIAVVDIETREVVGHLPAGEGPDGIGYSPFSVTR